MGYKTSERKSVTYYTQAEIISILRDEGYTNLSSRDLMYWREVGKLPALKRLDTILSGTVYAYDESVMDRIRLLCQESNRKVTPDSVICHYSIENNTFQIKTIIISRSGDDIKAFIRTDRGLLVKRLEENDICHFLQRR